MSGPVVVIGEPLVGFIATELGPLVAADHFRAEVVGAECNVAIALCRLGVPAAVIACTGTDPLGDVVERRLREEGVDTTHLRRDPRPTGILIRDRRGFGASSVLYRRAGGAGSTLAPADVRAAAATIAGAAWLHVSGVTAALSDSSRAALADAFALAAAHGVPTSLDVNYRARLWDADAARAGLAPLVATADLVLCGLDEGAVLTGAADAVELVSRLRELGAGAVLVKLGADGALLDAAGAVELCPAHAVGHALDEVGAGDAHAAGYIAARLLAHDAATALAWGATAAAFAITAVGDNRGLPTRAELERALGAGGGAGTIR